jgi:hypothetical protein
VREGLAYVWSNPVLRSISIMMALINLVATTANSQLVLFARRALHATNSEIGFLYAAGAAGAASRSVSLPGRSASVPPSPSPLSAPSSWPG